MLLAASNAFCSKDCTLGRLGECPEFGSQAKTPIKTRCLVSLPLHRSTGYLPVPVELPVSVPVFSFADAGCTAMEEPVRTIGFFSNSAVNCTYLARLGRRGTVRARSPAKGRVPRAGRWTPPAIAYSCPHLSIPRTSRHQDSRSSDSVQTTGSMSLLLFNPPSPLLPIPQFLKPCTNVTECVDERQRTGTKTESTAAQRSRPRHKSCSRVGVNTST